MQRTQGLSKKTAQAENCTVRNLEQTNARNELQACFSAARETVAKYGGAIHFGIRCSARRHLGAASGGCEPLRTITTQSQLPSLNVTLCHSRTVAAEVDTSLLLVVAVRHGTITTQTQLPSLNVTLCHIRTVAAEVDTSVLRAVAVIRRRTITTQSQLPSLNVTLCHIRTVAAGRCCERWLCAAAELSRRRRNCRR
jgi:hypothetical protein